MANRRTLLTKPDELMAALSVMDERWGGYGTAKSIIRRHCEEMRRVIRGAYDHIDSYRHGRAKRELFDTGLIKLK